MITRNLINITNHPDLSGVTRKAQVIRAYNEYDTNRVILRIKISHFINDIEKTYFPKEAELIASNSNIVNPTNGDYAEKDEDGNYPDGSMGEYDYLWYIVNTAKVKTQAELEEIYINLRIPQINSQLYK